MFHYRSKMVWLKQRPRIYITKNDTSMDPCSLKARTLVYKSDTDKAMHGLLSHQPPVIFPFNGAFLLALCTHLTYYQQQWA